MLSGMAERMIEANGVELCAEAFGDPGDPPILLIMGMSSSMIWWEEGFCRMLADGGRYVVRYDHRDTGRSASYAPGSPGYTWPDLVTDAARVLDGYGIEAAHMVGQSMGGALAQVLALDYPQRVLSLVLLNTSPGGPGDGGLPPISDDLARFLATVEVDGSDPKSVIDYVVAYHRALSGPDRAFDEAGIRELATRDVARARNFESAENHAALSGGDAWRDRLPSIAVPTLVIHGTSDPMFDVAHGAALSEEIPGARLLTLEGAGHVRHRADWDAIAQAILEHTSLGVHTEA
jgi:pimeloyl-ACP methyl ester carboxylesterase